MIDILMMFMYGTGCSFTVLVHTRDAATRNMEKVQVIKVRLKNTVNLQINSCSWISNPPSGCSVFFVFLFFCNDLYLYLCCITSVPFSPQDFPWIVADEQEVHMQEPRLIPLKTMTSDIVKVSRNIPLCLLKDQNSGTKIKLRFSSGIEFFCRSSVFPQMQLYVEERAQKI